MKSDVNYTAAFGELGYIILAGVMAAVLLMAINSYATELPWPIAIVVWYVIYDRLSMVFSAWFHRNE